MKSNLQRTLKISKFRNIGLDKPQEFVLNSNFEKGKMGNVLIVIGSNNSGKSNVLDGILKLNNKKIEDRDVTDLSYEDKDKKPSIRLCYQNDDYNVEYVIDLENNGKWNIIKYTISKETVENELNEIINLFTNYGYSTASFGQIREIQRIANKIHADEEYRFANYKEELFDIIKKIESNFNQNIYHEKEYYNNINTYNNTHNISTNNNTTSNGDNIWTIIVNKNYNTISAYLNKEKDNFEDDFSSILGVSCIPNIYNYEEKYISSKDLVVDDIGTISNTKFFQSLFNALDINVNTILNAYKQFHSTNNSAILNKLEKTMQPKIEKLNDRFNKMYFASNDRYLFTLDFESSRISFGMARGKDEDPITLEYQSTGFRWFFDLFFNFLATNTLKAGDIVIMDEPATNLHPQGQVELRKFIKEFAVKNDVLFIIATHSPFLIDPDNFDELRVISMDNNRSEIDNIFTAVNYNDPDSLLPIKESLTIKQNVLYDLDTEVIWVEGITDYIYLTMFKNFFDFKNIAFLPFNGVGATKEQTKEILAKLVSIQFHKKSILVDADKKGLEMYKLAKEYKSVKETNFKAVHNLSEIEMDTNNKIKVIEDLFSSEDKEKYYIIKEKRSLGASEMKIHAKMTDFTDETISNFKKLFVLLQDN